MKKTALEHIIAVLNQYKSNIEIIDQDILDKLIAEEIETSVRIDDSYALRGLKTIDQDIINQIDQKSNALSMMLTNVNKSERTNGLFALVSIVFLGFFLLWVFSKKMISPVKKLSKIMFESAHGNLDVAITLMIIFRTIIPNCIKWKHLSSFSKRTN